ncbi:MAG: TIGR03016 family PEP-CTERM system-associated outer membrane protein [Gammaproteobacteria bacterium]|nr:TIGR03016 family PEP-CTERM system-associated outer membrane protein [Gammaproteobacteria bacterium]
MALENARCLFGCPCRYRNGVQSVYFFCFVVLLFVAGIGPSFAGEWRVIPTIAVTQYYTDNISLRPAASAESESVTAIAPQLAVHGKGRRLKLDFDYRLQHLVHRKESARNRSYHQLQTDATLELAKKFFFVDASGRVSQQFIDPARRTSRDNIATIGNRADVVAYGVSPYLKTRFTSQVAGELRLKYDSVEYDRKGQGAALPGSRSTALIAQIAREAIRTRLSWRVKYEKNKFKYDVASFADVIFEKAALQLGYRLTAKLTVAIEGGRERNDYEFVTTRSVANPDDSFWMASLSWTPRRQTQLTLGGGERFFGQTYFVEASHQASAAQWTIDYREDVTTVAQQQFTQQVFGAGGSVLPTPGSFSLDTDVLVRKRFTAALELDFKRSKLRLSGSNEKRESQLLASDEKTYRSGAAWSWNLSRRTAVEISYEQFTQTFRGRDRRDKMRNTTFQLKRLLTRKLTAVVRYTIVRRASTDVNFEYDEERVSLAFSAQL